MNHRNPTEGASKIADSVRIVGDYASVGRADVFHVEVIRCEDGRRALYMHGLDFAQCEGWFDMSDELAEAIVRVLSVSNKALPSAEAQAALALRTLIEEATQ